MFMCAVHQKLVNKLDLTWKQSFLIYCYAECCNAESRLTHYHYSECWLSNVAARFKKCKKCSNTNIFSYLEKSGGQSSNLYLNVVHFLTTVLIRHLWQLKTVVFLHWCLIRAVLLLCWMIICWFLLCWVSLCWMSLCWVSLYWVSLCWVSFAECRYAKSYNA
jgi:hypothetical protein